MTYDERVVVEAYAAAAGARRTVARQLPTMGVYDSGAIDSEFSVRPSVATKLLLLAARIIIRNGSPSPGPSDHGRSDPAWRIGARFDVALDRMPLSASAVIRRTITTTRNSRLPHHRSRQTASCWTATRGCRGYRTKYVIRLCCAVLLQR